MKKFLSCIAAVVYLLSFFSCSNDLNDSKNLFLLQSFGSNSEYGTIVVGGSDYASRKLTSSDLTNLNATVSGYGMNDVTGTVTSDSGKTSGKVTVEKVTTGKNRVISIDSGKAVIRELIPEVNAGINTIPNVTWDTTVLGSIYYYLIKAGVDVSSIDSSVFTSAIPTDVHACFVNAMQIAVDYVSGNLKSASSYKIEAGTVTATVYGYSGKSIQIGDPASEAETAGADGSTLTFSNVLPGSWNVYADGEKVKTIKVDAGNNDVTIGNPYSGHMVVYVSASSAPRLWIWQVSGSYTDGKDVLGCDWNSRPTMSAADGMYNNNGWYMYDLTANGCHYTEGIAFKIKLNDDANVETGKTATFWYDAAGTCGTAGELYDSDPTENQLSNNANLASISVNGTAVSGFASGTTSYTSSISAGTTSATVTAVAEDSAATVSVSPSGSASIAEGASKDFTITVTAEDGTTKTYTVTVKRAAENDTTLASITVNGKAASISGTTATFSASGSEDSLTISSIVATAVDSNATVSYSATTGTVSNGGSKSFTITVKNGSKSATYTLTVSYTKVDTPEYYWTNKNGAYGTNKTISSFSDWTEAEKIVQGAANDDPRAFRGYHEKATDFYALYAAYDDTNLYLMVEMPSIDGRDITSKDWQYALDENLGMGVGINTGKRVAGDGEMDTGITPWNAAGKFYSITEGIDTLLMFHPSEYGTPGYFITNSDGKFSYDKEYCLAWKTLGVSTSKEVGLVSSTLYGRSDNYGLSMDEYLAKTDYVDMLTDPEKTDVSGYKYQITIPLSALGIDKSYIQNTGISVMTFSTFGTSMMDALPWCPNLIDVASEAYSFDDSSSHEKEDVDTYNVPLARIGK